MLIIKYGTTKIELLYVARFFLFIPQAVEILSSIYQQPRL